MYREECVKTVTENKSVYVFIVHWVSVCVCVVRTLLIYVLRLSGEHRHREYTGGGRIESWCTIVV